MDPVKEIIVGIDMGGTSLRALVVNARNEILAVEKQPTNVAQKPAGLIRDLAAMVEDVVGAAGLRKSQLRAVSIGAPGAADPEHGVDLAQGLLPETRATWWPARIAALRALKGLACAEGEDAIARALASEPPGPELDALRSALTEAEAGEPAPPK